MFRFNPRFDKWDRMESMRDTRTDFHVSVLNGCLYAIGGRNNRGPLSSAEKYRVDKYVRMFKYCFLTLKMLGTSGNT